MRKQHDVPELRLKQDVARVMLRLHICEPLGTLQCYSTAVAISHENHQIGLQRS
jgi:hypothetical protein